MTDQLTPDQTVRLLCAKVGELEARVRNISVNAPPFEQDLTWLAGDVALVAQLLADHITAMNTMMEDVTASLGLYEAHTENLIERVHLLENSNPNNGFRGDE